MDLPGACATYFEVFTLLKERPTYIRPAMCRVVPAQSILAYLKEERKKDISTARSKNSSKKILEKIICGLRVIIELRVLRDV